MLSRRLAFLKIDSSNAKIGDAAATYAAQASCPADCVFFNGGGCYAESGAIGKFVTAPLNEAARDFQASALAVAEAEAAAIRAGDPPPGRPLRLHGVGDCATDEAARIVSAAAEEWMERGGGPVWTYTHAWRTVARESWGKVSVLASCETEADVAEAMARGYAAALVVGEFKDRKLYEACLGAPSEGPARSGVVGRGTPVLPCPAQTTHGVACSSCRLCMNDAGLRERGYAIGFAIHGTAFAVKKAKLALADPDSTTRKLTSRDFIDSYLAVNDEWPTTRQIAEGANVSHSSAYEMRSRMRQEREAA